jgi:hypothetical protein
MVIGVADETNLSLEPDPLFQRLQAARIENRRFQEQLHEWKIRAWQEFNLIPGLIA